MAPTTMANPFSTATAPHLPNQFLHPAPTSSAAGRSSMSIKPTSIPPLPTQRRSTKISAVSTNQPPSSPTIPPWSIDSWKSKKGFQLPEYHDKAALESVVKTLDSLPPIIFPTEARRLEERLGQAALGNAFVLQGGDCAESFKEFSADNVRDTFKVLLQMSVVLMFGAQAPVIKVGTMAGQFAIARSDPFEAKNGVKLPSYYGDYFNGAGFDEKSRTPDPQRMIWAYAQSVSTLTHIKALSAGGYVDLQRLTQWNLDFVDFSRQGNRYFELTHWLNETFGLMDACGLTADHHPLMTATDFWTSHECLLLPYEEALTRKDSTSGLYYDCSAHMLWIGEQTRQLDGPHVEFLRGISNPIGIKAGERIEADELVKLIDILNPENRAGRITVITQVGAEEMRLKLPNLIRAVGKAGQIVTWVCDPMHGNTIKAPCGLKTRSYDSIRAQLSAFFNVHYSEGSHPGGVHLGMSGQDVTECVGGNRKVNYDVLSSRYRTHSDPRLNGSQSLELAFLIAERLQRRRMEALVLQG